MPSLDEVGLAALRAVLTQQIETRSLRAVARQIGMSPSGLQKFLDGAKPYSATRRRMEQWYVRESARFTSPVSVESARAALAVLVQDFAPGTRAEVQKELLTLLEALYLGKNRRLPDWLGKIRRAVRYRIGRERNHS